MARRVGIDGRRGRSTHALYYGARNTVTVLERRRPLGALARARRGSILATYALLALTRADRRAALAAVREGFADARAGRLGPAPRSAAPGPSSARR